MTCLCLAPSDYSRTPTAITITGTGTITAAYGGSQLWYAYSTATTPTPIYACGSVVASGAASTCLTLNAWDAWTATPARLGGGDTAWQHWNSQSWQAPAPRPLTEDERITRAREADARRAAAQQAIARAKRLFLSVLTDAQLAAFERDGMIPVESVTSRRRYLIRATERDGRHGNIQELDASGRAVASLCCAPEGNIPHFDAILGQKLALELDEEAFRAKANFTPLVRDYRRAAA